VGFLVEEETEADFFSNSNVTGDLGTQAVSFLETVNIGRRKSADMQ